MTDLFHTLHGNFLARYHIFFELPGRGSDGEGQKSPEPLLQAIDVMLAEKYNVFLSKKLREHLKTYRSDDLLRFWQWFEQVWKDSGNVVRDEEKMDALIGNFPNDLPIDMDVLWVKRFLSLWQPLDMNCLRCGKAGKVIEVEPCHHRVCLECFNGYNGCPICGRPVDRDSMLRQGIEKIYASDRKAWGDMSCIELGQEIYEFARSRFEVFCSTAQALSAPDRETLNILADQCPERVALWLPEKFGSPQVMAIVLGAMMNVMPEASVHAMLKKYLRNATDVLRLISVMSGEDGSLMPHPVNIRRPHVQSGDCDCCHGSNKMIQSYQFHVVKMSRKQRRMFLQILETFDANALKEDMIRRRELWIKVGEFLHPGDYEKRFPKVLEAFWTIRKKYIVKSGKRAPEFKTWRGRLENAIENNDVSALNKLLEERPGEFMRHIDRILRGFVSHDNAGRFLSDRFSDVKGELFSNIKKRNSIRGTLKQLSGGISSMISSAAEDVKSKTGIVVQLAKSLSGLSVPMLIQIWGHLRRRNNNAGKRVFYPAGSSRMVYWIPDKRFAISSVYINILCEAIATELMKRFEHKPHFEQAVIDEAISTLTFPFNERNSGSQALHLSPGSWLILPKEEDSGKLRLFLHWCEQPVSWRVDLDLSVAFFNEQWEMTDQCTYYDLQCFVERHGERKIFAHHSGDFTSAPYPDGATEYVDLDRNLAMKKGIRYAVMLVQVYAGVDFDNLERAYAGVMYRNDLKHTAQFDPRTVRYKYALTGAVNSFIPIIIDLKDEKIYDVQCYPTSRGRFCNLESNHQMVKGIAQAMVEFYRERPRAMRDDIALMHAAARCRRVWLRGTDGAVRLFERQPRESMGAFYKRLVLRKYARADVRDVNVLYEGGYEALPAFETPALALLMNGDLELPECSEYYIIFNGILSEKYAWTELANV